MLEVQLGISTFERVYVGCCARSLRVPVLEEVFVLPGAELDGHPIRSPAIPSMEPQERDQDGVQYSTQGRCR